MNAERFAPRSQCGGVDYAVTFGHIRGALLVELDDGAPDVVS